MATRSPRPTMRKGVWGEDSEVDGEFGLFVAVLAGEGTGVSGINVALVTTLTGLP